MSSIDTRVVEMKFDNAQFERGIRTTLNSLDSLRRGLKLEGAAKGLENVNAAGRRFSLSNMTSSLSGVTRAFSAIQVAGVAALATLASQATMYGQRIVQGLISPMRDGLREYETNLNSIQTILANTGLEGASGLKKVNSALDELNTYSDQTIYNFSEMARNIGTFTAAGVNLKTSTNAIKGIANLAAVSGSNSQQASTAMYQLSQALAAGKVSLMDWNSVVNAGMGGKVFQEALKETARVHGVAVDTIIKDAGSFRDSLEKGWITGDILTETLSKFTGDLSAAQLKTMGYNEKQIAGIIKMGKTATDAATKVKTVSQLIGTLQESAGSGWTKTWQLLFGNFDQARVLFTNVNNVLGGFISKSSEARNKVIGDWNKMGGRTVLIDAIAIAFRNLIAFMKPIKDAFKEIFPAKTGKDLFELTVKLRDFAKSLKIGADTSANLKRTFAGVFAIFSILGQILGGAVGMIQRFFGAISDGSGGFLNFTGGIGDFLVSLDKMLKKSGLVQGFFTKLGDVLAVPLKLLGNFSRFVGKLFSGFDGSSLNELADGFERVGNRMAPLQAAGEKIVQFLGSMVDKLKGFGSKIVSMFEGIGEVIGRAFASANYSKALDTINTGLFAGLLLLVKKFFSGGGDFSVNIGGGVMESAKSAFESVTTAMQNMQTQIKADIILKIAGALALLTASIVALSMIDGKKLAKALVGLSIGFVALQLSLVKLSSAVSYLGTLKLPIITASLVALAGALVLIAVALKIFASINIANTVQGLIAMGGSLAVIAAGMRLMPKGMVGQAFALSVLAGALNVLAIAVKLFATISWDEMAHGLAALGGAMVIMAAGMRLMPKGMLLQAVALGILALALNGIAVAMKIFGTMDMAEIGKGLLVLAGALLIIAGATALMGGPSLVLTAAGLVAVAFALNIMAGAMMLMGKMSWEAIGKSMVVLAGALILLAGGLTLMIASLPGAAALVVAAGALMLLVPALIALGSMEWGMILKSLAMLAGVFVVLGVAGLALAPIVPVIIALAAALVLIGAGLALAGVGALAFSTAFSTVVAVGAAGVGVLAGILKTFLSSIPQAMAAMGRGVVAFAGQISRGGAQFFAAFQTILSAIIRAIDSNIPKIGRLFMKLVDMAIRILVSGVPKAANAGLKIITGVLQAINNNIGKIIPLATSIIVKFINGIAAGLPKVIQAGVNLVISFVNGVADAIRNNSSAMGAAGANLGTAIVEGMARGLSAGAGVIASKARGVAQGALNAAKSALGIHSPSREFYKVGQYVNQGFAKGLTGSSPQVYAAYNNMRKLLSTAMREAGKDVDTLEKKLTRLRHARRKDHEAIRETTKALAQARKERSATSKAYSVLTKSLDDDRNRLASLARKYDAITAKLDAANKRLADAKKTRDDYNASIKDQYSNLPDITAETHLTDYVAQFKQQIEDTQTLSVALQQLRKLGLNDAMYKELLAKGTDALPFIRELLDGGKGSVDELNKLGSQLSAKASALGNAASKALYQAGVDAAAGLVAGLKKQQAAIDKEMTRIANYMIRAIKKALGIKSPSREMAKVGVFSAEGLANGLKKTSSVVQRAAEDVGHDAISSMRKSISGMSKLVISDVDLKPTIRPVLDLTDIKKNVGHLDRMFATKPIRIDGAYEQAKEASAGYIQNRNMNLDVQATPEVTKTVTFVQNNNSPKALTPAEIYRQTRNQLSVAKGALT